MVVAAVVVTVVDAAATDFDDKSYDGDADGDADGDDDDDNAIGVGPSLSRCCLSMLPFHLTQATNSTPLLKPILSGTSISPSKTYSCYSSPTRPATSWRTSRP